jgi:hypothetical protein
VYNRQKEIEELKSRKFHLPKDLEAIAKSIENSKYILDLEEGWDENGAKKVESKIWEESVNFLIKYSKYLYNNYQKIIEAPEINPCNNNSIDLSWRTKNANMLINIREKEKIMFASYYGHFHDKTNEIEGEIAIKPLSKSLAIWMKNLSNK